MSDDRRFFEDLSAGECHEFGSHTVTEAEIFSFAEQYDPQPFHVDREAAEASMFGGLVASGWHTVCLLTRMAVDEVMLDIANKGGRGASDLRWLQPLRPGDVLTGRVEVLETTPIEGRPDRGDVTFQMTGLVDDEPVVELTLHTIVARRAGAD